MFNPKYFLTFVVRLDDIHFDWSEVVSQSNFNFHFPNGYGMEHVFKELFVICISLLKKVYSVHFSVCHLAVLFTCYLISVVLCKFWILVPVWSVVDKDFLQFCIMYGLLFSFLYRNFISSWCLMCWYLRSVLSFQYFQYSCEL